MNTITAQSDISDKVIELEGIITSVKCLQVPNFEYNQNHVDNLVRFGFLPTDSVYEVTIKFQSISKKHIANITELYQIAKQYDISSPRKLPGTKVNCTLTNKTIYDSLIKKIETAKDNQTPK